ncbi:hypothetical protein [Vibrio parahaemolyticus]|uniref:hypothetical protein n=1 Tax=Vibrio parahaemolyticus TaxID=670 RepID=UPI000427597E|nr:hypothetical protein [Vibrio parahaemolyticus]EID0698774.1 hypothetical protein [Vibrio parahaemolyticus]EKL9962193.1 hypothetical protein [Vibrio parahaemolyticus]ELB2103903.1 hypothetical protein [Vibrio parahaemolyticus]MDF5461402.1 hypothetical protein [Vibrio parahaemolyticus]TOA21309.1 hypothetical protein CGK31_20440 [Vibrio parahaemolyticus]
MKVFATQFLEAPSSDRIKEDSWTWTPENPDAKDIYGSGASTSSNQSTYAAEKDNRADSDRPNEGMRIAA